MRAQLSSQLHALCHYPHVVADVERRIETLLATINEQIIDIERGLNAALRQDEAWAVAARRLQIIKVWTL